VSGITVTGLKEARALLKGFSERRLNAAAATALTRTAVEVRDGIRAEMGRAFDRPTRFVVSSVYAKPATAAQPVAEVGIADRAVNTLTAQVRGGVRVLKKWEGALARVGALPPGHFAVPGAGAQLDAFGNLPRKTISDILTQLGAHTGKRATTKATPGARRGAVRRSGGTYFVTRPGKPGLEPGIWLHPAGGGKPKPVILFVRAPGYSVRLPFEVVARRLAEKHLQAQFERAFTESAARLAARG
jgi:hypothetical protein